MINLLALPALKSLAPIAGFPGITEDPGDQAASLLRLTTAFSNLIAVLTIFAGFAFLVWFIIGALTWITSADKTDRLEQAKNQMTNALVGLLIIILAIPIISVLGKIFGLDILNSIETIIPNLAPS